MQYLLLHSAQQLRHSARGRRSIRCLRIIIIVIIIVSVE
jgi:hypothetical protein